MKKFFSMVLSILLIFSVMSPVTVFAENGPYPFDPGSESLDFTEFSTLSITDMETYDMEILYPQTDTIFNGGLYPGASYNLKTNTLTLNNVKAKTSVINASEMGDDFKIKLIGYNELAGISSNATTRGASVTITGKGELVLNRDDVGFGIIIFAGETTSVLNIEETVKLKAYFSAESETPAISVFGSSIRSSAELINLGGKVVSDKPEFKKYTVNVYEQIEAYDLDWNYYDWYEFGLKKDGAYYIADAEYDEETYEPTGKYLVYSVKYDKLLDCYTLNEYANGEGVSLDGFTKITEFEPMLDEKRGFYIGYTDYPDEEDDSYKTIFYPQEKEPFDICVDKNGTKYGFIQYDYEEDDEFGTDTFVYKFIEHPKYGTVAVLDETKDSLDGLTPLKIAEKKLADKSYYSDVIINNGGSVTEPAKIKNIKANNTNQGVRITWSADSSATQYRIYRKAAGELYWKTLDTISASKTSFVDKTAKSGKKYTYTVKGYNYVGWGEANSKGTTITFYEAPIVTTKNITTGVNLKWTKIAGATKYRIYRKTASSSEWTRIDTVKGTSFTDKTAKSGKKYYYRVKAGKSDTMSGYNVASQYFLSVPKLSSVKNTINGVKINWEEVNGADSYKVYRKYGNGGFEYIGKTTKTTYTDKTTKSGKTYTYTVKATKNITNSAYNTTGLKIKRTTTTK